MPCPVERGVRAAAGVLRKLGDHAEVWKVARSIPPRRRRRCLGVFNPSTAGEARGKHDAFVAGPAEPQFRIKQTAFANCRHGGQGMPASRKASKPAATASCMLMSQREALDRFQTPRESAPFSPQGAVCLQAPAWSMLTEPSSLDERTMFLSSNRCCIVRPADASHLVSSQGVLVEKPCIQQEGQGDARHHVQVSVPACGLESGSVERS